MFSHSIRYHANVIKKLSFLFTLLALYVLRQSQLVSKFASGAGGQLIGHILEMNGLRMQRQDVVDREKAGVEPQGEKRRALGLNSWSEAAVNVMYCLQIDLILQKHNLCA